jgi:hypothetical protein
LPAARAALIGCGPSLPTKRAARHEAESEQVFPWFIAQFAHGLEILIGLWLFAQRLSTSARW